MEKFKEDQLVLCPFYLGNTKRSIKCEGYIGDTCTNFFEKREMMLDHKDDFCRNQYKSCAMYQFLMEKYNE